MLDAARQAEHAHDKSNGGDRDEHQNRVYRRHDESAHAELQPRQRRLAVERRHTLEREVEAERDDVAEKREADDCDNGGERKPARDAQRRRRPRRRDQ